MSGAFGDIPLSSLPKIGIGRMAEVVEDDVLSSSTIHGDRLVMLPVTKSPEQYDGMTSVAIFLRRLEPHAKQIATMLEGRRR